jgi:hypothetical protein
MCVSTPLGLQLSNYVEPVDDLISQPNFLKREIASRFVNLASIPAFGITSIVDTIIGIAYTIFSMLKCGYDRGLRILALDFTSRSSIILCAPLTFVVAVLNPHAKFDSQDAFVSCFGNGLITPYLQKILFSKISEFKTSDNMISKHILSRICCVLIPLASVVTRAVDTVIGVIALCFSIITLGTCDSLNNLAARGLKTFAIVHDICHSLLLM